MADGTRIFEPSPDGTDVVITDVDSEEVIVDGALRDRQKMAVYNPKDGTPLEVAGSVTVTNPGPDAQQDALTDAELRATPVDVHLLVGETHVGATNPLPTQARVTDANGNPYSGTNPLPVDVGGSITIDNLSVQFDSQVSTLNSRTTPLVADEVFVGAWEEVVNYAAISATIYTDAPSAYFGAVAQFSHDGVEVINQTPATIPPNVSSHFTFSPKARYFRVVYQNGPFPQTVLRVEVTFRFNPPVVTQTPVAAPLYGDYVGDVTKSVIMGKKDGDGPYGAGEYLPVHVSDTGALRVDGADAETQGLIETVGGVVEHVNPGNHSSFSLDVRGSGTWVIERQVGTGLEWTTVGAFLAGSTLFGAQWSQPGAFHGNISSAHKIRIRAIDLPSGSLTVFMRSGAGVGTVTIGIGRMQTLGASSSGITVTTISATAANPQRIDTGPSQRRSVLVRSRAGNPNGSKIYVGFTQSGLAANVGTVEMGPGDVMTLPVTEGRQLYAFQTGGNGTVEVIEISQ